MLIKFITTNDLKFRIAEEIMRESGIRLSREMLQIDEIQHIEVREIARESANIAFTKLGNSIAVTDVGFYFNALNGFPGPFIKYINDWLNEKDILRLLENKKDDCIIGIECLIIVDENGFFNLYEKKFFGRTTKRIGDGLGTMIEKLFIPVGYDIPISEMSEEQKFLYWKRESPWNLYVESLKVINLNYI